MKTLLLSTDNQSYINQTSYKPLVYSDKALGSIVTHTYLSFG